MDGHARVTSRARDLLLRDPYPFTHIPRGLGSDPAWREHIPFALWIMRQLRPTKIIELGLGSKASLGAFCQATQDSQLETKIIGIEEQQNPALSDDDAAARFNRTKKYIEEFYPNIATVLQESFHDALAKIEDGSIDLLHLNTRQKYHATKRIFESCKVKLSQRSVVLFHGIAEIDSDQGIGKLFKEIELQSPIKTFRFQHASGLGVLGFGEKLPDEINDFLSLNMPDIELFHHFFKSFAHVSRTESYMKAQQRDLSDIYPPASILQAAPSKENLLFESIVSGIRESINCLEKDLTEARLSLESAERELMETRTQLALSKNEFAILNTQLKLENEFLRAAATKFLRSPFVPLRNTLRYKAMRGLANVLRRISPALSERYQGFSAELDPKRFMQPGRFQDIAVSWKRDGALPETSRNACEAATPVLSVPFSSDAMHTDADIRLAVVLHLFDLDEINIFRDTLRALPAPFSLYIYMDADEDAADVRKAFDQGPQIETVVRVVSASGRCIAPIPEAFADPYEHGDLILFLRTSGAKAANTRQVSSQRNIALKALLGSRDTVTSILSAFAFSPDLGIVAPPNAGIANESPQWRGTYREARILAERMGVALYTDSPVYFPKGQMFWARPAALRPLLDAIASHDGVFTESSPADATHAEAMARLLFYSCERAGLRWIHAGSPDQLSPSEYPLNVANEQDLKWALSDQMPALLLPGRRPNTQAIANPVAHLQKAKDEFRRQCVEDLGRFLSGDDRLTFANAGEPPALSIILVLYNQSELTFHCLKSLHRNAGVPVEIILLDNGSSDETATLLDRLDGVKVIRSGENLHFLRGVNQAAAQACGTHLLLLNNDTRVLPGTIPAALARLDEDQGVGAVGGPITLVDGSLQEAGSIIFRDGSCLGYGRGRDPGDAEFRFRRDVDYCSGAFLMMRRDVWEEMNGFDEAFAPAYYEETDLCMRIWASGRRIVYDPDVKIVHFEFGSSKLSDDAIALQKRNSEVFREKHDQALLSSHLPSSVPPVLARQRRDSARRVLVIEDRVPMPNLGSGYPRSARILSEISACGWSATLYPTDMPYFSCTEAYSALPNTTELTLGNPLVSLPLFLRDRIGCYDAVLVSRPHNMARYRDAVAKISGWEDIPVLYDAEAIFAERNAALARLGDTGEALDHEQALSDELALSQDVRTIFSVGEADASVFRANGHRDVRVLGHALSPRPLGQGPAGRRNMLFVGALDDEHSPNTDSLNWFVKEIMPQIDAAIGTNWTLDVVGRAGAKSVRALESNRVRVFGKVDDLDAFYAQARLFIAPTRYAAGIPMKVHEAASVGLPTVATAILAGQLGWTHGKELLCAENAKSFARNCATLYHDDELWQELRAGGLSAIERDCSPQYFRETLRNALADSLV